MNEPHQHHRVIEVLDDPGILSVVAATTNSLSAYGARVVVIAAVGGMGTPVEADDILVEQKDWRELQ